MKLNRVVLKAVRAGKGRPVHRDDVARAAGEQGHSAGKVANAIDNLVHSGHLLPVGRDSLIALRERNLVVGRLSMTRHGYAFVENPGADVFVPAREVGGAMHGDVVAVRLSPRRGGSRGLSGEVVHIVERSNKTVVGRFERQGKVGVVVPHDRRIRSDVFIAGGAYEDARHNDMVVARITRYPADGRPAQGVIEEVVGKEGDPGVDIEVIIREHGLRTAFPPEVLAESEAIPQAATEEAERGRKDLRELGTITIDPVDAKDFDDAISIERVGNGWRLWVHIADVSHYVPWDSRIDNEGRLRATSVYLVDRVLPMLPESLSNGICSLKPGEDRLAMTVEMDLDRTGLVERYSLYPSVIRSDRRLDYDQVDEWLSSGKGFPDTETETALRQFQKLAATLNKRRIDRGGLDFETVEARVVLDEAGKPLDVRIRERTVATNMIEEAMIRANEVVAEHMTRAESPMVYRIHEDPDPDALDAIAVILKEFDYPIKDVAGASPRTFQKIVDFAHGRPERLLINSLLLRALKRARYVHYLASHFGLASEAYTHFTSPIRRYPDLLVHRLLKAQLTGTLDEDGTQAMAQELGWLTEHCSLMEREAESAEDDSQRMKLCELMAEHVGEVFSGIVTGVASFGMFVQLPNTAEGMVHVQTMADDYYRFDAEKHLVYGESSGKQHRLGDELMVRIVSVSVAEMRIDLEIA